MPCMNVKISGVTGIACYRGGKAQPRCGLPGCNFIADYLCDGPGSKPRGRKTCDMPLCENHRHNVGPERDLCPGCRGMIELQPELPGLEVG